MQKWTRAAVAAAIALSGMAVPTAADASTACTGLSGCKIVSRADVDGDGRADQVGVRIKTSGGTTKNTVRVRTAKGRLMSSQVAVQPWAKSWHGAARIDGRAGYELVIPTTGQSEYLTYRVLTYREGRLVTLKTPQNRWSWDVVAEYAGVTGWARSTRDGKVFVTRKIALRVGETSRFDLRATTYQWKNGAWSRPVSSTRNTRASQKAADSAFGWNISYLKRF